MRKEYKENDALNWGKRMAHYGQIVGEVITQELEACICMEEEIKLWEKKGKFNDLFPLFQ